MKIKILISLLGILLIFSLVLAGQEKKEEKKEEVRRITEEIVVEAERPRDLPLSTSTLIKKEKIDSMIPRDLSDVLPYSTGTFVSSGSKNEFRLKIRGFENQSILLLYDGIPIYEPFFNSFDLKTIPTTEIENIKIVKGASSVLYGPNALGGIVNIITKRPQSPSLSLNTSYDSNSSFSLNSSGSLRWNNVFVSGFFTYDRSDGFKWNKDEKHIQRANSDYERQSITGKMYFYPSSKSEILLEASRYWSEYGIPFATEYYAPRYWRFKSWNRLQLNLGGTFSFGTRGSIKSRSYYVRHDNVLDAYTGPDLNDLEWESTYKNDSFGTFLLGSLPYSSRNEFKLSLNYRDDNVRTQDDRGQEWEEFEHKTLSLGLENLTTLNTRWQLVGGVSLDHLRKFTGENKTTLNPIAGLKFNPSDFVAFHLALSRKSRFPSMKALYSSQGGNPDLRDERGMSYEFGFRYEEEYLISGAVFYNRIHDLIQAIRFPDGSRTNLNIGRAHIFGFELEFQKTYGWLDFSADYTYLEGENEEENRPLDLLPKSQFDFVLNIFDREKTKFTLWGLFVSDAEMKIREDLVKIPGYFVLNAVLSRNFSGFTVFLKVENLLDKFYVTEPGYPMKARTFAFGFSYDLFSRKRNNSQTTRRNE